MERNITRFLEDWSAGDDGALTPLMEAIYGELRRLAGAHLKHERADHTLDTSALVHEAYLRLIDQRQVAWQNRAHFLAIAAKMMRRVLVNYARERHSVKRGGAAVRLALEEGLVATRGSLAEHLSIHAALLRLEAARPRLAKVVELRFFGGLTRKEIAEVTGVSIPTVARRLRMARAWLYRDLGPAVEGGQDGPARPG